MIGHSAKTSSTEARTGQMTTIIAEGCVVDGPVSAPDSVRVDGVINGNLTVHGSVIVGTHARISGNISADNVFLAGEISGNVDVRDGRVEISNTGRLHGDIMAHSLVIDEDAVFQGQCTMTSHADSSETAGSSDDMPHGSADEAKARLTAGAAKTN